jgi:hypothetical protein
MELKDLCKRIMALDHIGVQCDHIHKCEEMHQTIRELDKMDRHEAVRLLMHVIHVQQLQLVGAKIEYDNQNPFNDMVNFDYINDYVKNFSPDMETLY